LVEENDPAEVEIADVAGDDFAVDGGRATKTDDEELADFLAERGSGGHGGIF
jgi:hypothetical protein